MKERIRKQSIYSAKLKSKIKIILFLVFYLFIQSIQASMPTLCTIPEPQYLAAIKSKLSQIKTIDENTNQANIAYIISAAISAQSKNKIIKQNNINKILGEKSQNVEHISFLQIKQVLNKLGTRVSTVQVNNAKSLVLLKNKVLITQDKYKNYITLVASSETTLYFLYGKNQSDAILCPINKQLFNNGFTINKFIVLDII